MALLIFAYRKLDIIRQQNELEYRLMKITRKLQDLQQYSSNIADGSISMNEMMSTPGSMFGRQMTFMMYAHNMSVTGAQYKYHMMQPMIAMQMQQMQQNPQMQAMYQQWMFRNLYQQERQNMAKLEAKNLKDQETAIQQEKAKIETQIKMLSQELESVKQAENKGAQEAKPEYVA